MARPQIAAGELGAIVVGILPSGRYRARASTRDDSGALHRVAAVADTDEEARADVRRQAMALSTGGSLRSGCDGGHRPNVPATASHGATGTVAHHRPRI